MSSTLRDTTPGLPFLVSPRRSVVEHSLIQKVGYRTLLYFGRLLVYPLEPCLGGVRYTLVSGVDCGTNVGTLSRTLSPGSIRYESKDWVSLPLHSKLHLQYIVIYSLCCHFSVKCRSRGVSQSTPTTTWIYPHTVEDCRRRLVYTRERGGNVPTTTVLVRHCL